MFHTFFTKRIQVLWATHKVREQVRGEGWVQKGTGAYRGKSNGVWVHARFEYVSSFYFSLWNMQILQTLRVKVFTNGFLSNLRFILPSLVDFQELHRCCVPLQVFIILYWSNSRLWNSLNFMQLQVIGALALNFRFVLVFDNSRIKVQFRNKLTFCKVNMALQTILSVRLYVAPAYD